MKRLQCEVCGSTEIKKVGESTYECMSCGIRYDKDDVRKLLVELTGSVKIDHSDEVENHIRRAEQLEAEGNTREAEEHYNAALDLDASNATAQEGAREASKKLKYENFFIADAKLSDEETAELLLREMAVTDNIVCDIYKEINIRKIIDRYDVLAFLKGKYKLSWSATICYREYENQTVYKKEYDSRGHSHSVPTTERVAKIRRVPSSGERVYETDGLVLANDVLSVCEHSYDKTTVDALCSDFENLQDNKYATYTVTKLDSRNITEENSKLFYKGIEINFDIDEKVVSARRRQLLENADQKCADETIAAMAGDYYENLSATRQTLGESTAYICIPVQVIEYTYKSQNYLAICDLVSHTASVSKMYPEDRLLAKSKKGLRREEKQAKNMPGTMIAGIAVMILILVWLLIMAITDNQKIGETGVLIGLCGAFVLSVVLLIVGAVQKSNRAKSFQNKTWDMQNSIYSPRMKFLANSYKEFFGAYNGLASLDAARSSVSASVMVEMNDIGTQISYSGEIKQFDENFDDVASETSQKISDLEAEIKKFKNKRNLGIVLMCVSCFIILPLFFAGIIILGNANRKIIDTNKELSELKGDWIS